MVDLDEEHREMLEALRRHRGHRSHAETVRELIRMASGSGLPSPEVQAAIKASALLDRPEKPKGSRPGFQSRLKGEWKAP